METFWMLPEPGNGREVWLIPPGHRPKFRLRTLGLLAMLVVLMTVTATLGTIGFSRDAETAIASFWPATALQAVFSIWFGIYGVIAGTLGPMLGHSILGQSVLQYAPANFIQSLLPGVIFRLLHADPRLRTRRDWWILLGLVCIGCNALGAFAGNVEASLRGMNTGGTAVENYLRWFVANAVPSLVLTPLLLWAVSAALVRQRAFFQSFWAPTDVPGLGPCHWLHLADMPMLRKLTLLAAVVGVLPLCILAVVAVGDAVVSAEREARDGGRESIAHIRDEIDRHELQMRVWISRLQQAGTASEAGRRLLEEWSSGGDAYTDLSIVDAEDLVGVFPPGQGAVLLSIRPVVFFEPGEAMPVPESVYAAAPLDGDATSYLVARCLWRPGSTDLEEFIGQTSAVFITDRDGRVLRSRPPASLEGWSPPEETPDEDVQYGGTEWAVSEARIDRLGWRFIMLTDIRSARAGVLTRIPQPLTWVVNLAIFAAVMLSGLLSRRIASRVLAIADRVARSGGVPGKLHVPVTGIDELGYLAETLNQMSDNLAANISELQVTTAEKDRLVREVDLARALQRSVLPARAPEIPGYALTGFCGPALDVGGDFYDFFIVPAQRVAVMVGDASGKGLKASMFMAETRGIARASTLRGDLPDRALRDANRAMTPQAEPNAAFVTMFCAVLDPETHCLHYSNAGHNRPLIVRGQNVREISEGSFPIAVVDWAPYECHHLALDAGDIVVMYSDGVTEAASRDGDQFGQDRLEAVLRENSDVSVEQMREAILKAVRDFAAGGKQSDDITVVVLKRLGPSGPQEQVIP